jgi:predicted lipoprotein with Yx(FWY)xxD motif
MRRTSTAGSGVLAVTAVAAILLAGCGGSSKPNSSTSGSKEGGYATSTTKTSAAKSTAAAEAVVIGVKSNAVLGKILAAGPKKLTVYMFASDHGSVSTCYGACATAWPPVITTGTPKAQGGAIAAKIGTITRSEGAKQVTYAGRPLYYYTPDSNEAAISGQGLNSFGALWWVMSPSGEVITKS